MKKKDIVIIGITGMPGAKKTMVAKLLSKYGIPYFTISSILREELINRGLEPTPENYAKLAKEMREKFGEEILAKKAWEFIKSSIPSKVIIIDGIRSPEEVSFFKNIARHFLLLLVHASPSTRFKRFKRRKHSFIRTIEQFKAQEESNLELGIGEVIAQADYVIINESYFKESLKKQVDMFYRFLERKVPMFKQLLGGIKHEGSNPSSR
jgi:dephospho-CoA kinase